MENNSYKVWEVRGDFATKGIKKMARRTFQDLSSNIEEIIANAYDEDAKLVKIIIDYDNKCLNIIDDGNGMDEKSLASYVIYGESNKTSAYKSPLFQRTPIGEYGIGGKLAITNLCNECKIVTHKNGKEHIFFMNKEQLNKAKYVSDIKSKVYTSDCDNNIHGTTIYMKNLCYKKIDSERLIEIFSLRMPKSVNFKIIVSIIENKNKRDIEVKEPLFDYAEKFDFESNLETIGKVSLVIYYTKEPVSAKKQGIWTKVNGRIVNEKQNWFGIENLTSGHRYKYRLYGTGEADGLKDYITFSKNDFVNCPEYKEYYEYVSKCLADVQKYLLKRDEDVKKERDRELIKDVEKKVNNIVSKLDDPLIMGNLKAKIKKEFTKNIEEAPDSPFSDFDKVEEEANKIASIVNRGKDKRERRNQSISRSEKMTYSGRNYTIDTVDLSETGNLVEFIQEKSLIEINEKHKLFLKASKNEYLDNFVMILALTEISNDYSEGNLIIFNNVFNQLLKIAADQK